MRRAESAVSECLGGILLINPMAASIVSCVFRLKINAAPEGDTISENKIQMRSENERRNGREFEKKIDFVGCFLLGWRRKGGEPLV